MPVQWGRYHSDFLLGSRPYVSAALIGATYASYNLTLYVAVPSPDSANAVPLTAMIMTGDNFTNFQVCGSSLPQDPRAAASVHAGTEIPVGSCAAVEAVAVVPQMCQPRVCCMHCSPLSSYCGPQCRVSTLW